MSIGSRLPHWPLPAWAYVPGVNTRPASLPADVVANEGRERCFARGLDLLDHAYWWEAHELLEALWHKSTEAAERRLLQGLIQLAASALRAGRGDADAAATLLDRAVVHLEAGRPHPWWAEAEVPRRLLVAKAALEASLRGASSAG